MLGRSRKGPAGAESRPLWKTAAAAGALGLCALGLVVALRGGAPDPAPAALRDDAPGARAEAAARGGRAGRAPAVEAPAPAGRDAAPRPGSLRGTEVDGALRVDARGNLILGPEVLAFFDYFLSAGGEESDEAIRDRIVAAIDARLDGPAAAQAIALLDEYLAYREAAGRLPSGAEAARDPAARLEAVRRLRRERFGEEAAELLFGDEEREAAAAVAQREVLADPSLGDEERAARLAEIEAELPEAARAARDEATRPLRQRADEEALRAGGATEEEIRAHRVATVGEEGADRLDALDQRRAAWKQRVEAFRAERARIAASTPDEGARRAAEEKLLEASFSPEERLRVKAILSLAGE